jgi:adenylosuccinate lyase
VKKRNTRRRGSDQAEQPPHYAFYDERLWPILDAAQRIRRRRDFSQVSPWAYRYINQTLAPYTSEQGRILIQGAVEASIAIELYERGDCPKYIMKEIIKACTQLRAADVYRFEYGLRGRVKPLHHDVRALVKRIKQLISERAQKYPHLMATSCDILDTADAARLRDALVSVIIPGLKQVLKHFIRIARQHADTVQVGRTHLKHASPQTFGNAVTEYVVRLGKEIVKLEKEAKKLVGKFSGPVGTYGPSSLIVKNPVQFERRLLSHLGLPAGRYSTQKSLQQPLADVYHRLTSIMAIFGDLGDSFRKLQATEVAEVAQAKSTQGSSSIMAHKYNPIALENIKSLNKAEVGRMIGVYLDLISDHQRDLTNSASGRFHIEIVEFVASVMRVLNRILPKLVVNEEQMMRNLNLTGDLIISDPLNTLLTYYGHPDAHGYVTELCDQSQQTGEKVFRLLMLDESVKKYVDQMTEKQLRVLQRPSTYIGLASKRTIREANFWRRKFGFAA